MITLNVPGPRDYGLPHDEWRPGQLESIDIGSSASQGQIIALEHGTGAGKSGVAAGIAYKRQVTYLARTLSLVQQIETNYGFDAVFGRSNYPCPFLGSGFSADSCAFSSNMAECPEVEDHKCEYYNVRERVLGSQMRAMSYSYYWHSRRAKDAPGVLVCDEGHRLADEILSLVALEISYSQAKSWKLPSFPEVEQGIDPASIAAAYRWVDQALSMLPTEKSVDQKRRASLVRLTTKLEMFLGLMDHNEEWFVESNPYVVVRDGKVTEPYLRVRSLTAAPFTGFLTCTDGTILLSATFGAPQVLAEELGIPDLEFISFPHVIPAERRPVFYLADSPKMSYTARDTDYTRQAELIAREIKKLDPTYRGIIHVSRWSEVELLARRLSKLGLDHRVWIPPKEPTHIQVERFKSDRRRGIIALAPSWWEGVDLHDDLARICIIAKVPFQPWNDPYVRARATRPLIGRKWYDSDACRSVMQGCGRIVRSATDLGYSFIVDANWLRVQEYASEWFRPQTI